MYTLKEIRKILNIQEQDSNEDSWSDGDAIETNEGDGKPFTPFELAILRLIHQNLTKGNMEDVLRDHAYPGDVGKKWINIAKLVGLRHSIQQGHSIDDIAYDKRYVKWALDNWTEDGDYASIEKPIKVPPKRYKVDREESGTQTVYKDGSTTVIGYDEDSAADSANTEFWDWGGEMETTDYGDYETYDSEITHIEPVEVLSEEKQKEFNELVKLCQLGEKYTPKIVGGVTRETLTQFLKENINDMVYIDEPKEKHIKRMNRPLGPLEGFPIEKFKNMPPPENESTETEEEIDYLDSIPVEKGFVNSADDVDGHFKKFLEPKGLEFPTEELKDVMKGVKSIILQLKYHYNRPRPYQVADAKNLKLDSENLKSASTPSYPSGHATQGTFLGRYLADLYPEYEKELRQIGEDIAFSRNMAKVHYPSDSEFGKMLGNDLYEFVYQPEEELNEQVEESSSEYGGDKLLVPIQALEQYGNTYLKKDLKKILTNILECLERTCYQIGEPYFLSMIDEDGESVQLQSTCSDCTHLLDETLQTLDAELIKMGFLKGNDNGMLVKPFPKEYNRWVEDIMQEINPGFFIDDNDEVSYKDLGNAHDAYYDLSEQISPEALQDLYAFHGEEFDDEMDEEVKPSTQLSGEQGNFIRTLKKLQEKRKISDKVKHFTNKKKEDLKKFWSELTKGAKRERKETAEAVKILARLIKNRDSVTKEDITFLKEQSGDIARIIALISLGAVSVVIPVGLEKLLNQYGISIMPRKRGKDEDGNGIDDYIDVTQDDNLLNESKQEISPELEEGDLIKVIDTGWEPQTMEGKERIPDIFITYKVVRKIPGGKYRRVRYDLIPEGEGVVLDMSNDEFMESKSIFDGDIWIKVNPTETLNESKQEISPVLKYGDVITILDIPTPTIGFGDDKSREERQSYAFGEPQLFKPYWVWKPSYGAPKREGTYIIVPLDEVSELQKLGHLKPEDEGLPAHLHRKLRTIRRSRGDQWVKTNQTEPLNESKQQFNPDLKEGDFIRIYDVDKDSPIISREGYTDQDRYMMYGGESIPEIFKVYVVMLVTKYKTTQFDKEGEKMYVLMGPDMNPSRPYYIFPSHDTWVKLPKEEGMEAFKEGIESYHRMNLNESDPKTGTGKKPKGSGRRLYTDEDPSDTVSVKFRTKEDIVDTLNKSSFKSKSHKRQSQIINLIHQRVRAAHKNAKDPETKKRLKRALDYITNKKEKSKEKTKKLNKLNESTQTNQPLQRGDEVMIVDLDHSTQGYMTGRLPISLVTPDTFKPYRIFGITNRRRENWEGPDADTRIYQLEPVDITDEERHQDMISGGGYRVGLHMIPGDTWILQKRPENWYDNLHESKQERISPKLEIGDKIRVIEIDGEHARMPKLFTTVYEVIKKGGGTSLGSSFIWGGEYYDLLPEGFREQKKVGERDVRDDFKTIYSRDVWVKVSPTETLNEQREPAKLNPELKMGDEIMVVDVNSERESGETSYTTPPTGRKSERYIPYVVVEKNSNGHQSEWPWKYVVVEKRFLEKILKLMEEKPGYDTDWTENLIEMNAKFLYPWIYQWIKTGEFNELSKFGLTETLNEETTIFGQGLMDKIKPEEFEGTDEEWEEMISLNADEVLDIEDDYEYFGGKTDPSTGFVAPSKEVTNNICKVKGFCKAQGPITFGQLRELVKAASSQRLKTDMGRGTFRELWRIVPFFIPQVLLAAVGAELARVINKIISPALKDAGSYKSWWGQVVMKTMNVAEGTAFPNMVLGDDPLTKVFFISDGLLHMISDKYKLKFAKYVADVAASKPDDEPVPDWFVENLLRDYLNQKFLLDPPLPVKVSNEPLNEQQFPFNPNNKDIERDHPEGEPDWSIRRGDQHYAMNVENTPNEPVAAFNNYLVKNSPFIIEGFDFYLSAVPGNMPQSAIVDVYVPMMDDSAVADDIWNKDRIYYQRAEDWYGEDASYGSKYQGRKEKLHNLDYDQKFAEFTYYEDFQEQHPEYIEYLEKELGDSNLLNEPGAQYEMIWRTKRMNLQNELDSIAKLFGVSRALINRDPRKPWKRQRDGYNNEKIRPGKLVPRGWPRP